MKTILKTIFEENAEGQIEKLKKFGFVIENQSTSVTYFGNERVEIEVSLPGFTGTSEELKAIKREILNSWFTFDYFGGEIFCFKTPKTPYSQQIIMEMQKIGWTYINTYSDQIYFECHKIKNPYNSVLERAQYRIAIQNILKELKEKYNERQAKIEELKSQINDIEREIQYEENDAKDYNNRIKRLKGGEIHLLSCNYYCQNAEKGDIVPGTNNEKVFNNYAYCLMPETLEDYKYLKNKNLIGKAIPSIGELSICNVCNKEDPNCDIYYHGGFIKFISEGQLIIVKVVGDEDM